MSSPISIQSTMSPSILLEGVTNTVHAYITIETGSLPGETQRPPASLCVVLDKSGSMASQDKLRKSKLAIKDIIDRLDSKDDFCLVLYDSSVTVPIEFGQFSIGNDAGKMKAIVDGVTSGSCTNLHGGLKKGLEMFAKADGTRTRKIFLFSDGLVNEGVTSPSEICALSEKITGHDITVDSFGVGDDYGEDLMTKIGESGAGRFMHIESAEAMQQFVSYAMGGILTVLARSAVLKLRGCKGVTVQKVYGHDNIVAGARLNTLTANNSRGILAELEVKCSGGSAGETMDVLNFSLTCEPVWAVEKSGGKKAKPVEMTIDGKIALTISSDDKEVGESSDNKVEGMLVVQKSAADEDAVTEALRKGKRDEAIKLKEAQLTGLEEAFSRCADVQIESQVVAQRRMLEDMKEKKVSVAALNKRSHKNKYHCRHDSATYCGNEMAWDSKFT
eukprot:TRINITY_DN2916_c0_g2_i2.p1 TRINITY_DN2916_c0_g2~~TRINITY_DN2916_c0_g2_i2.p1  ORF type:complete len:457 (-),score=131.77 TRINITY_DN2916_c0_g2_i2:136-1470(-)